MDSRTKKTNNKRFVRYSEGAEMYSMSVSKFMQLAKDAKACYKVNQLVLVNLDIMEKNEPREKKCIDFRSDQKYNMTKI